MSLSGDWHIYFHFFFGNLKKLQGASRVGTGKMANEKIKMRTKLIIYNFSISFSDSRSQHVKKSHGGTDLEN